MSRNVPKLRHENKSGAEDERMAKYEEQEDTVRPGGRQRGRGADLEDDDTDVDSRHGRAVT